MAAIAVRLLRQTTKLETSSEIRASGSSRSVMVAALRSVNQCGHQLSPAAGLPPAGTGAAGLLRSATATVLERRQALVLLQASLLGLLSHQAASAATAEHRAGSASIVAPSLAAAAVAAAQANTFSIEPPLVFIPYMTPEPVEFPRRQLDLSFAVLLLRSMYDAVDALDFVAMQQFQKEFWKLRASEQTPYNVLYEPLQIKQGDLTNPLYLDFIAFAQGASISQEMARGKLEFRERDEEAEDIVYHDITRDPALTNNALLPGAFNIVAGDIMYDRLRNGFREVQYGGVPPPAPPGANLEQRAAGVQQLLDVFVQRGFALNAAVSDIQPSSSGSSSGSFTVRLEGPANLWSLQMLAARRCSVSSAHSALATGALLRAGGAQASCRISWTDTAITERWTVSAGL